MAWNRKKLWTRCKFPTKLQKLPKPISTEVPASQLQSCDKWAKCWLFLGENEYSCNNTQEENLRFRIKCQTTRMLLPNNEQFQITQNCMVLVFVEISHLHNSSNLLSGCEGSPALLCLQRVLWYWDKASSLHSAQQYTACGKANVKVLSPSSKRLSSHTNQPEYQRYLTIWTSHMIFFFDCAKFRVGKLDTALVGKSSDIFFSCLQWLKKNVFHIGTHFQILWDWPWKCECESAHLHAVVARLVLVELVPWELTGDERLFLEQDVSFREIALGKQCLALQQNRQSLSAEDTGDWPPHSSHFSAVCGSFALTRPW